MRLKVSSAKWRSFGLGINVLNDYTVQPFASNFLQISINHMEYTLVVVQGFFNAYGNTTWEMFALVLQKDFSKWILFSKRFIEVCLVFQWKKRDIWRRLVVSTMFPITTFGIRL